LTRQFNQCGQTVVSVLLAGIVVWLLAMVADESLHKLLHADADESGHTCAVTLFAHGQVDSASIEVPVVALLTFVETVPAVEFSIFSPAIENLPAGRAPPVLPAVS
jgi:hypothetical protein